MKIEGKTISGVSKVYIASNTAIVLTFTDGTSVRVLPCESDQHSSLWVLIQEVKKIEVKSIETAYEQVDESEWRNPL